MDSESFDLVIQKCHEWLAVSDTRNELIGVSRDGSILKLLGTHVDKRDKEIPAVVNITTFVSGAHPEHDPDGIGNFRVRPESCEAYVRMSQDHISMLIGALSNGSIDVSIQITTEETPLQLKSILSVVASFNIKTPKLTKKGFFRRVSAS